MAWLMTLEYPVSKTTMDQTIFPGGGIGCAGDLDGDGADELLLSKIIQTVVSDPDPFTGQVTTTVGQGHVPIWQGGTIPDSN